MNKYWLCTSLLSTRNSQHHLFRTMGNHHGLKELLRRRTVTRKEGSSERFRSRRRSREKNGIIRINTWEWFYAIRSETKRLVFHFNPWLWKEKELSITYSPRPPIYSVTLHHLNSNRADGSSLHSGPRKIDGDVRAGTPGRGYGKKGNG